MSSTELKTPPVLVIGVGNACQGDDAIGLIVARELQQANPDQFQILEHDAGGSALIESWGGAETVILIDAVQAGNEPGSIYRFDVSTEKLPYHTLRHSTHAISIGDAIELARVLNRLPLHMIVYGIEGQDFTAGANVSSSVQKAVPVLLERIRHESLLSP